MTERRPPKRSQRPAAIAYAGSLLAFVAILGVLAVRVAAGADPAIGQQATAPPPAKRVLVRRIVRRVIVTHPAPRRDAAPATPAAPQGSGVVPTSAPAPAPAAAPAPAPAPAPALAPTTRSS